MTTNAAIQRERRQADACYPTQQRCRYCACDVDHRCELDGGDHAQLCGWADRRHTICTAPACLAQAAQLVERADNALHAARCICGAAKSTEHYYCYYCNQILPYLLGASDGQIRAALGEITKAVLYEAGCNYLRIYTSRMDARGAR